jgi:hypothetical protein
MGKTINLYVAIRILRTHLGNRQDFGAQMTNKFFVANAVAWFEKA